jgi:hypothetical protein
MTKQPDIISDREAAALAKKTLGQFNTPESYRDLPASQQAVTYITLPGGETIKASGFAHERQVATMVRRRLGALAAVTTTHAVVARQTDTVIETRATFVDCESGISRRGM